MQSFFNFYIRNYVGENSNVTSTADFVRVINYYIYKICIFVDKS